MLFSIIVPVYNMSKYVRECIDSILNQNFEDYELILVDDGSKDDSGIICDEYAKKNNHIKVIHKPNGGLSSSRNTGLDKASGDWVLFVDSDDYIGKETLSLLRKLIFESPADLYTYNLCKINENGDVIGKDIHHIENHYAIFKSEEQKTKYIYNKLLFYHTGWEACVQLFNRDIIEKNNLRFVDNSVVFAEDLLFTLEYYMFVEKVYYICNFLYYYRQIDSSIMHSNNEKTIIPRLICLAEYFYDFCKTNKKKAMLKEYYKVYFSLMDFHIQHKQDSLSDNEITEILKRSYKKINKRCLKTILDNKSNMKYCIGKRNWLEYDI